MADENYSYAPKYVQIQNYILQKIESGEYTAGDKIPSETELARQFDVSRLTVNTAVKELANSGIVERVQGKVPLSGLSRVSPFPALWHFPAASRSHPLNTPTTSRTACWSMGHQGGCCLVPEAGPDGRKPLCL